MTRLIAFLRAINVGGRNVSMQALREHVEALGLQHVETFIASGNLIFTAPASSHAATLEKKIEAQLAQALGYEVNTFIRSAAEVTAIAHYQPFDAARLESAGALNVAFMVGTLSVEAQKSLMALTTEIDDFHVHGREIYWLCTKKQSESKFSNALLERKLQLHTTFRSISTLRKLAAKYAD